MTPPLRLLHSCEPYVKASKRLKANWNFFSALRMHLNKQGVRGKIKMKCTWTTGTKQNKKDKVQNLCNEMSLHEESVPQFSLLRGFVFLSKCALSFQFKMSPSIYHKARPHTIESLISEPSLTRGRGHAGEISTWLSLICRGLFSDSEKLLLLSGDEHSCGGVLQM